MSPGQDASKGQEASRGQDVSQSRSQGHEERRRPRAVRIEMAQAEPGEAAPRAGLSTVEFIPDPFALAPGPDAEERAVEKAQRRGIVRRSLVSWGGLFWSASASLASLAFGLWVTRIVDDLFSRSSALGAVGLVLAALIALALAVLGGREILAIGRQRHIAKLHGALAGAHAADDRAAARRLVAELADLYKARPETASARRDVLALRGEIVDGRDLLDIAERTLVQPLDLRTQATIARAAKRVSMVTTLAPRAIIDVAFVAIQAARLIREIAEIYGGRPGLLGFLKLARSVGAHLAITGGMAAGDSLLQQVVGHGIAAKISARLGEGVLNGLLTARIGLSAMAVCRPMPFAAEPAPTLRKVVPFLFRAGKVEAVDDED